MAGWEVQWCSSVSMQPQPINLVFSCSSRVMCSYSPDLCCLLRVQCTVYTVWWSSLLRLKNVWTSECSVALQQALHTSDQTVCSTASCSSTDSRVCPTNWFWIQDHSPLIKIRYSGNNCNQLRHAFLYVVSSADTTNIPLNAPMHECVLTSQRPPPVSQWVILYKESLSHLSESVWSGQDNYSPSQCCARSS